MPTRKLLRWIGSSREDLCDFPAEVRRTIGYALHFAQMGDKHPSAKPLQGFGGAGVLEIVEDHDGETYRAITQCALLRQSTCSTPFKRSRSGVSKRRSATWIASECGYNERSRIINSGA